MSDDAILKALEDGMDVHMDNVEYSFLMQDFPNAGHQAVSQYISARQAFENADHFEEIVARELVDAFDAVYQGQSPKRHERRLNGKPMSEIVGELRKQLSL